MQPGQYNGITLANAMKVALDTGRNMTGEFTVTYDVTTNQLVVRTLDATATFHIYPTAYLKANASEWNAVAGPSLQIDENNLMDACSVIGFSTGTNILLGNVTSPVSGTEMVNTLPDHQLFLRSSLGNGYDAIGPDGSSDIIRRITCQVALNDMIVDQHSLPHDSVTVGSREISSLSFRLTDCFGTTVDTKGHHISFSIIFLEEE